ncbi:three-Cys-motif partner protein TcmP [Kosmotoga pacifica]|uniref:Three-Cys-motif partner protein TcmP n=1 Tax=Kosmotoga pacifica TaxID=1330330 RepID=A0A0G2Z4L7_9BACT|nr:three-Cys-motif partner protein TcmP [Kosmotoga pacifica]AKI96555.1 hypothetical protein IX53_00535 [Kosmotoga pacifica]
MIISKNWKPKEHSEIKEKILGKYLFPWFMKVSSGFKNVFYIDTCSGPGIYKNGFKGSPIIALEQAYKAWKKHERTTFHFRFIDKDNSDCKELENNIRNLTINDDGFDNNDFNDFMNSIKYECINEDYSAVLDNLIFEVNELRAASFTFIDPYNATTVPMKHIIRFMDFDRSEVLYNFMLSDLVRTRKNRTLADTTEIFGEAIDISVMTDEQISNTYEKCLKKRIENSYVLKYIMRHSEKRMRLYDLYHLTHHKEGLKIMKGIMRGLSTSNHYFSNDKRYNKEQLSIFIPGLDEFRHHLCKEFDRKEVKLEEILERFVMNDEFLWDGKVIGDFLVKLRNDDEVEFVPNRKRPIKSTIIKIKYSA